MKYNFKHILFLLIASLLIYMPAQAQKKKKNTKQTTTKKKAVKTNNKSIKAKTVTIKTTPKVNTKDPAPVKTAPAPIVKTDSLPEKVVTILSAFKPQLKNLAKIDFVTASERTDTGSVHLEYQVPSQNLSFQYQPISLVPRAYKLDSTNLSKRNTQIKFGYGNYFHHFIAVDHYFIDGNKNTHSFNIDNESITGSHHLQSTRTTQLNYLGDFTFQDQGHLLSKIYYKQTERYRYGLVPDTTFFPLANFKQNSFVTGASVAWMANQNGSFNYAPNLGFERFEGIEGATNNFISFKSPFSLDLKNETKFNFDFSYSLNQFSPRGRSSQTNQLVRVDPSISFNKLNSKFTLGVSPILTSDEFLLKPTLEFQKVLNDTNIILAAGWHTLSQNNSYANVEAQNPWVAVPDKLAITTQDSKYVQIQISNGKRLNYGFSLSLNDYSNLLLFNKRLNTIILNNGLYYVSIFEKKASTIQFDANLRYQFSDHFLFTNNLKYIQFNSLQQNAKPWGILPFELNSKVTWTPNKKLQVNGNMQYWSGASMLNDKNVPVNLNNAFLLNASLSYALTPKLSTWVKGENLLDNAYQRWANYPAIGVQFIAGVVYSFK